MSVITGEHGSAGRLRGRGNFERGHWPYIGYNSQGPDDVKALVSSLGDQVEPWYAEGGVDFIDSER
jgi:hypothetical protein